MQKAFATGTTPNWNGCREGKPRVRAWFVVFSFRSRHAKPDHLSRRKDKCQKTKKLAKALENKTQLP